MAIYFNWKNLPEVAGVPREVAGKLVNRCWLKGWRHWQLWLAILIAGLIGGMGLHLAQIVEATWFGPRTTASFLICGLIGAPFCVIGFLVAHTTNLNVIRPYLRTHVAELSREST